jgi:hypothetical protein
VTGSLCVFLPSDDGAERCCTTWCFFQSMTPRERALVFQVGAGGAHELEPGRRPGHRYGQPLPRGWRLAGVWRARHAWPNGGECRGGLCWLAARGMGRADMPCAHAGRIALSNVSSGHEILTCTARSAGRACAYRAARCRPAAQVVFSEWAEREQRAPRQRHRGAGRGDRHPGVRVGVRAFFLGRPLTCPAACLGRCCPRGEGRRPDGAGLRPRADGRGR